MNPEYPTPKAEPGERSYAYFSQDGIYLDTFTLPADYDHDFTIAHGQRDRKFIVKPILGKVLKLPAGGGMVTIDDLADQLDMAFGREISPDHEEPEPAVYLSLESLAASLRENSSDGATRRGI